MRLSGHDYASDCRYFVTLCAVERAPCFGVFEDGAVRLNSLGTAVADAWRWLPGQYSYVTLDESCVMPDHLHGILIMGATILSTAGDSPGRRRKPLGELIGAFKTVSTKRINALRQTPGAVVWQRDFWDHIVRDADDMIRIRAYIRDNARFR
jgi:REP element-mobilizing transposase RayT